MEGFTIIKKDNKFFVTNEFFGDMMIYAAKSLKPYVKRLGSKFYLTGEMYVELKNMM